MKNLAIQWTKNTKSDHAKKELEKAIRASSVALTRLQEILKEELASIEAEELKSTSYDKASWPFYQAHLNGEKKRIKDLLLLLSFLDK
jgi:hypothetical protein